MSAVQHQALRRLEATRADYVVGVDEVGYGCLAGPLVTCAVVVPRNWSWKDLRDSKSLRPQKREQIFEELVEHLSLDSWYISEIEVERFDMLGAGEALKVAHREAVSGLAMKSDKQSVVVVVDGIVSVSTKHIQLPGGDDIIPAIAAASVIAKVMRDRWMAWVAHAKYPHYAFDRNKGYGSAVHMDALVRHGPCPLHRKSYKPVQNLVVDTVGERQ